MRGDRGSSTSPGGELTGTLSPEWVHQVFTEMLPDSVQVAVWGIHTESTLLTPTEQLVELKLMMEELNAASKVCFDHDGNYWRNRGGQRLFSLSYEGYQFPDEKPRILELIEEGLKAQEGTKDPRHLRGAR